MHKYDGYMDTFRVAKMDHFLKCRFATIILSIFAKSTLSEWTKVRSVFDTISRFANAVTLSESGSAHGNIFCKINQN